MDISAIDQEISDLDWFAVDLDGHVIHFASAGGILPASVAASKDALASLTAYFSSIPQTLRANAVQVAPDIKQEEGTRYDSFLGYARRGLFSFDRTNLERFLDTHYHLIARPQHQLTLSDLPMEIANVVNQTHWPFSVDGTMTIDISAIA